MKEELIEQYFKNFIKLEKGEWTKEQWYEYCSKILCQLMDKHSDVFVRLKNR
jgi:hypothetical protein